MNTIYPSLRLSTQFYHGLVSAIVLLLALILLLLKYTRIKLVYSKPPPSSSSTSSSSFTSTSSSTSTSLYQTKAKTNNSSSKKRQLLAPMSIPHVSTINKDATSSQRNSSLKQKRGWLIVSSEPLTPPSLNWHDNLTLNNQHSSPSIVAQSMRIVSESSSVLRRVISNSFSMISPSIPLKADSTAPPYLSKQTCFSILDGNTLTLHSASTTRSILSLNLKEYSVSLFPRNQKDYELFWRMSPICLVGKKNECKYFLYAESAFEKENWFILMRRASIVVDSETEALLSYEKSMKILLSNLKQTDLQFTHNSRMDGYAEESLNCDLDRTDNDESKSSLLSSVFKSDAWVNALIGRLFVSLHASTLLKHYLIQKINRDVFLEGGEYIGDVRVMEICVGDSAPVFSELRLINMSIDGDLEIEACVEYDGGLSVKACAQVLVPLPLKSLEIPIEISVKVRTFSAKMLIKIKPFWETSRIWFGFYDDPVFKLEVEPLISNRLVKFELVNQIIEERVKVSIAELAVLPNMDDLPFFWFGIGDDGIGGIFDDQKKQRNRDSLIMPSLDSSQINSKLRPDLQNSKTTIEESFNDTVIPADSYDFKRVLDLIQEQSDTGIVVSEFKSPITIIQRLNTKPSSADFAQHLSTTNSTTSSKLPIDTILFPKFNDDESIISRMSSDDNSVVDYGIGYDAQIDLDEAPTNPNILSSSMTQETQITSLTTLTSPTYHDYILKTLSHQAIEYNLGDRMTTAMQVAKTYGLEGTAQGVFNGANGLFGYFGYGVQDFEKEVEKIRVERESSCNGKNSVPTSPIKMRNPKSCK